RLASLTTPPLQHLLQSLTASEPGLVMTNPVFPNRFRANAAAQYLQRPFFVESVPAQVVEAYWEQLVLCNAMLDRCIGVTTVGVVRENVKGVLDKTPLMISIGDALAKN